MAASLTCLSLHYKDFKLYLYNDRTIVSMIIWDDCFGRKPVVVATAQIGTIPIPVTDTATAWLQPEI